MGARGGGGEGGGGGGGGVGGGVVEAPRGGVASPVASGTPAGFGLGDDASDVAAAHGRFDAGARRRRRTRGYPGGG